jgi:hypothetical protein
VTLTTLAEDVPLSSFYIEFAENLSQLQLLPEADRNATTFEMHLNKIPDIFYLNDNIRLFIFTQGLAKDADADRRGHPD